MNQANYIGRHRDDSRGSHRLFLNFNAPPYANGSTTDDDPSRQF